MNTGFAIPRLGDKPYLAELFATSLQMIQSV